MTRDRVLNIHTVNAALRRGLGGVMSACRMLARVGNRPPRQPYSASTLTVSRCYERRGEQSNASTLSLSLILPGCARVIVSTVSSGSSPPSRTPCSNPSLPHKSNSCYTLSLSLSACLSISLCATSATLDRHLTSPPHPLTPGI